MKRSRNSRCASTSRVELVGIARQVGVVADDLRLLLLTARPRAGNDRLQLADLAVLEGVGGLPEIVREAARERQFVQRVDPVRPVVELPVAVRRPIAGGVVSAHADVGSGRHWSACRGSGRTRSGSEGALPSTVKMFPGTLLPVPILCEDRRHRAAVIVPNCAWPSARGAATAGTVMSWIIHPSYQPLSLLMTNSGGYR